MSDPKTLTQLVSDEKENWKSTAASYERKTWSGKSVYDPVLETMVPVVWDGVGLANQLLLRSGGGGGGDDHRPDDDDVDHWETLARVWVRLLLYAAPYGNKEAHVQHLAQGGEFITHLWALLYHLNISEWKLPEMVPNITTVEHAESILKNDDGQAIVVAFLDSLSV